MTNTMKIASATGVSILVAFGINHSFKGKVHPILLTAFVATAFVVSLDKWGPFATPKDAPYGPKNPKPTMRKGETL